MKPRLTLASWGGICLAGLVGANVTRLIYSPAHLGPLSDEERGVQLGIGLVQLTCFLGALVCFLLHFALGRPGSRRGRQPRRHFEDEDDTESQRPWPPAGLSVGVLLGIVAGLTGALVLAVVVVLFLFVRPGKPQPPVGVHQPPPGPLHNDQDAANRNPPPPPDLEKMERIWILLNTQDNRPIKELTFQGPAPPPNSYANEISNVRPIQGPAPPAGVYYNQRFSMRLIQDAGQIGGIAVPSMGPFTSTPLPSPCHLVYTRKVGSCQVDFRNPRFELTLTFGVFEGFYRK